MEDLIPCEFCGQGVSLDRYAGHSLLCALTSSRGVSHPFPAGLLSFIGTAPDDEYERNLRIQEDMGGSVKKACKDINLAAPVADNHSMERCPVCLQNSGPRTRVRRSAVCSHEFCAECLERWLSEHTTCPICVADMSVNGGHRFVMDDPPSREPPTTHVERMFRPDDMVAMALPSLSRLHARPPALIYSPTTSVMLRPPATHTTPLGLREFHARRTEDDQRTRSAREVLYHFGRVRDILEDARRGAADRASGDDN